MITYKNYKLSARHAVAISDTSFLSYLPLLGYYIMKPSTAFTNSGNSNKSLIAIFASLGAAALVFVICLIITVVRIYRKKKNVAETQNVP